MLTDIFGNNLSDNKNNNLLPFIMIKDKSLLDNIPNVTNIKKINHSGVVKLLQSINIDPQRFAPLGDVNVGGGSDEIVLVNIKITKVPVDYMKMYEKGNVKYWLPVGPRGYYGLGYILSNDKPCNGDVRVVDERYLKKEGAHHVINLLSLMYKKEPIEDV